MSASREVAEAVGAEGTESLERKRERLRRVVATPSERDLAARELLDVETQIAERDRATLTAEAKEYISGEVKAIGSLVKNETKLDGDRLLDAAREFARQLLMTNEHFESIIARRHRVLAVCEVFGIQVPELPAVVVPASRKAVQEAFEITSRVGVRDNGFVQPMVDNDGRRTYGEPELAGTDGLALIQRKLGR